MEKRFPNLLLEPPIFYNWEIGLRFELGDPKEENDKVYFERVYERAKTLFAAIHAEKDELFIVAHDYQRVGGRRKGKRTKLFISFLREKNLKYKIHLQTLPYEEADEDEEWCKQQFSVRCQVKDISHRRLVNALFSGDMPWIYFVNMTKGTIFHIYDDRGCDLAATTKEAIEGIYHQYNGWILDYDREKIDEIFK